MGVIVSVGLVAGFWLIAKVINVFKTKPKPLPNIDTTKNWGSGEGETIVDSELIEDFAVDFESKESRLIEFLRKTLENGSVNAASPLNGIGFEYGVNSVGFNDFLDFWANNYLSRWSERQKFLNGFPQFTTEIQGYGGQSDKLLLPS